MRRSLDLPSTLQDARTFRRLSLYQFVYSLCGLALGLACGMGGVALFLNGVAGNTNWTARALGVESQISDAAPGAILFVVGLLVIVATRFTVRVQPASRGRAGG
ncbi:MAG: hypothetical protein WCP29_12900 [Acidobacteriota bacterium]